MANALRKPGHGQYATLDQQDFSYDPALPQESRNGVQEVYRPDPRMPGGKRAIYLALACIVVPMLGLSAILIGLVYGYQVERNQTTAGPLVLLQESDTDDSAYYVHINSTTFATIASWSSTVAPLLVVAAMSLASFPTARRLREKSIAGSIDLPTPFQLSLLLETLTGSIMSVWTLIRYRRWPHKQPLASLVRSAFVILLLASIMGYIVAGIDTWLHLVMDTVEVDLISTEPDVLHDYGRIIDPNTGCSNQTAADFDVRLCSVDLAVTGTFLTGANIAYRTLANLSSIHAVRKATLDDRTLAYLGPANIQPRLDFQASTLAMHTQCTPIAAKCNLRVESGASEPFHCSDAFFGDLPSRTINGDTDDGVSGLPLLNQYTGAVFYEDEGLTKYANDSFTSHKQNPYYLGVWGILSGMNANDEMLKSGNIVRPMHGGVSWVLGCTATAYELTYSWVNGSATVNSATVANGTVGTMINAPIYYGLGKASLDVNAYAATGEEDAQALADSYAYQYSRTAMALFSGTLTGRPTIVEQQRERVLVARVPKAPLYLLVAFNIVYGVLGIVLAVLALSASPSETNEVRERLSIAGIVASSFEGARARRPLESKKEMFAEHFGESSGKVGIQRSGYEGWEYTVREHQKQIA